MSPASIFTALNASDALAIGFPESTTQGVTQRLMTSFTFLAVATSLSTPPHERANSSSSVVISVIPSQWTSSLGTIAPHATAARMHILRHESAPDISAVGLVSA